MHAPTLAAALSASLTRAGDDAPAAQLARVSVDHLLTRPLLEVVDAPDIADAIVGWLATPGIGLLLETHGAEVVAAEQRRAIRSDEVLSEYTPAHVVQEVTARLARPWDLPEDWADSVVDPTFVRAVLADALGDLLEEFVSSLPLAGAAGSLLGSITRKA
ncbi:MAG: hypothetical protein ACI9WU_003968, partial [Myxococcota bacterium]